MPPIEPQQFPLSGWRALWREFPVLMRVLLWAFVVLLLAATGFTWRSIEYGRETRGLRRGLNEQDALKADLALASDARRLQLAMREARTGGELYLSIAVDSGLMHVEQRGAILRSAMVAVGADGWQRTNGDSVPIASPRGIQRVQDVRGDSMVVLSGGATLYRGDPSQPARAGSVRINADDFRTILPNLKAGLPVYFY